MSQIVAGRVYSVEPRQTLRASDAPVDPDTKEIEP